MQNSSVFSSKFVKRYFVLLENHFLGSCYRLTASFFVRERVVEFDAKRLLVPHR